MLFGQSIFQSVVERLSLEDEEKPDDADGAVSYRVSGLNTGFVHDTGQEPQSTGDWAQNQYLDLMAHDPLPQSTPEVPPHLNRLSAREIAEDLGLAETDDVATLQAKRRAFAMNNHPDRVHASFAESAHIRMTIANQLVDDALHLRTLQKR